MKRKAAFLLIAASLLLIAATPIQTEPTPDINAFLQALAPKALWLAVVIGLDLILGVTVALKDGVFEWQRLADFLGDYGPKVIGWLALECLGLLPAEYAALGGIQTALGYGAYSLLFLAALASVLGHVSALGVLPGGAMAKVGVPPTPKPDK